jgi:murein DD-endopeptidase MepM/ murein hydrolase activator NlpD
MSTRRLEESAQDAPSTGRARRWFRSVVAWASAASLAVLAAVLLIVPPTSSSAAAATGDRPDFQMPFACGQTWELKTYRGHNPDDKKLDMYRVGGGTNGSEVRASAAGVVHQWFDPGGLEIDHGNGWFTVYLHMSARASVGSRVGQGDWIGTVGMVGTSVAHLHYEQLYDFNGDHDGETDEMVPPVIQGVAYQLSPDGPFPTATSRNGCGGPQPPHGCDPGYVCYYPGAGWNSDRPSATYFRYGTYNLSGQYGAHRIFNNQTGGAEAFTCTGWNGGGACSLLPAGQWADRDMTPVNSIRLAP